MAEPGELGQVCFGEGGECGGHVVMCCVLGSV